MMMVMRGKCILQDFRYFLDTRPCYMKIIRSDVSLVKELIQCKMVIIDEAHLW